MTYRCVIGSRNQLIICPAVDLQDRRVLGIQAFGKHGWEEAEGDCSCNQSWRREHVEDGIDRQCHRQLDRTDLSTLRSHIPFSIRDDRCGDVDTIVALFIASCRIAIAIAM